MAVHLARRRARRAAAAAASFVRSRPLISTACALFFANKKRVFLKKQYGCIRWYFMNILAVFQTVIITLFDVPVT